MLLTYGQPAKDQPISLFSIEKNGIHTMPLFTDLNCAMQYGKAMSKILQKQEDNRNLNIQVCTNPKLAVELFETITVYQPDLMKITVNPATKKIKSKIRRQISNVDIDDFLNQLREIASNAESKAE